MNKSNVIQMSEHLLKNVDLDFFVLFSKALDGFDTDDNRTCPVTIEVYDPIASTECGLALCCEGMNIVLSLSPKDAQALAKALMIGGGHE